MQRTLEARGIATVGISLLRKVSEAIAPPRTYVVRFPFGHALGRPGDAALQRRILLGALELLETAATPGTIVESGLRWRRGWAALSGPTFARAESREGGRP